MYSLKCQSRGVPNFGRGAWGVPRTLWSIVGSATALDQNEDDREDESHFEFLLNSMRYDFVGLNTN